MDRRAEIIDMIESIAGRYSAYEVYHDWVKCMAIGISNSMGMFRDKLWAEREKMYLDTIEKYEKEEVEKICLMTALLTETLEDGPDDVLGNIYMRAGLGSKSTGQFFTPFHISQLVAAARINTEELTKNDEKITMIEPSCGGGGMILAAAKVLDDAGIDYQKRMRVVAQDLDWKGVYMCYVQLSLLGINAICVQGDSMKDSYDPFKTDRTKVMHTPARMGVLL